MEFEAAISYGSGKARFRITKENPGIYYACLLNFDKVNEQFPPSKITLIRGIRCWRGSDHDDRLINALGHLIEDYFMTQLKKKVSR
jgi:hypothetical protein